MSRDKTTALNLASKLALQPWWLAILLLPLTGLCLLVAMGGWLGRQE